MFKLLHAINHMHYSNIAHRDIKCENLLLSSTERNAEVKIIDFGLSKEFTSQYDFRQKVGTLQYIAPEVL